MNVTGCLGLAAGVTRDIPVLKQEAYVGNVKFFMGTTIVLQPIPQAKSKVSTYVNGV